MSKDGATSSTWKTQEDFERDLILYAEYDIPEPIIPKETKVPKSIQKFMEQMAALPKNQPPEIDETCTYVISGRGRGIADRLVEPGKLVKYEPLDDLELRKSIREVSGLGYSNEFIEKSIKQQACNQKDCAENFEDVLHFSVEQRTTTPSKEKEEPCDPSPKADDDNQSLNLSNEDFPPLQ